MVLSLLCSSLIGRTNTGFFLSWRHSDRYVMSHSSLGDLSLELEACPTFLVLKKVAMENTLLAKTKRPGNVIQV